MPSVIKSKSRLLERLVLQASSICHLFEHYICPNVAKPIDKVDSAELYSLIDSISQDQAREIHDIYKTISNRLLDFGLEHTLEYLRKGE